MFAVKIGPRVGEGSGSMKRLWVAAALAPLSFAAMTTVASDASAAGPTSISTSTTTPLLTSTSGNITITSAGSIKPTAGPAAVTVDASGDVSNAGAITYANVSNSAGVLVDGGVTSTITNTGVISQTETTTGQGTAQSIVNGPFANGSNRYGIEVTGAGVLTGSIINSGTITVTGENSAGIAIGTEMTGNLSQTGVITVTGGTPTYTPTGTDTKTTTVTNAGNVTYGIESTGKIDGNVTLGGTISATGQNAVGVALSGGVGGAGGVDIDGAITATGYRSVTPPTDPTVLANLTADQTLQGGPAVEIGGNVVGGITLTAAVAASGNVAAIPEGILTVYGSAPALQIGGDSAITVGANTGGFSLQIGGSITGNGDYPDVNATGIQIGGTNGLPVTTSGVAAGGDFANVTLSNGIDVTGVVNAVSESHTIGEGEATAILIGKGGTGTSLTNSGTISASVASDTLLPAPGNVTLPTSVVEPGVNVPLTVTGITVAAGGSLTSINNSGVISATITGINTAVNYTAAGGIEGEAVAINDQSGTVTSVTNTNTISASLIPIVPGQSVVAANSDAVAMYLANVDGSVTVTQSANGNTSITPTITGMVIFGNTTMAGNASLAGNITGSENLDLEAGTLTGAVEFNGAGNNTLTINGGASMTGDLAQAADGNLNLNILNGTLDILAPTSNKLGGSAASIHATSLHIGAKGVVVFSVDPNATKLATGQFNVSGTATIDAGAKIGINLDTKLADNTVGNFTLIHAGTLVDNEPDASLDAQLPYLYEGNFSHTGTDLDVSISQKTTAELGFNPAQSAAYEAIYNQMSTDSAVVADVLSQTTRNGFLHIYNQFLPDYAGGPFEALASSQRDISRAEADAPVKLLTDQTRGWVQEIGYLASRDSNSQTNGYQAQGFGLTGGIEHAHGDSAIGVTASFVTGDVQNATQTSDGRLSTVAIEGGVYWRAGGEGLNANASINGGYVSLGSHRLLIDQTSAGAVSLLRDAESQWSGAVVSGQFGLSYQVTLGRFYMRPEVAADYIALYESAHDEKGGGPALNLGINSRTSTEASIQADMVFGYTFGQALRWRPELTVGYRDIVAGGPASTTAHFLSGGQSFTLTPDLADRGGLLARLGVRAIGNYADITADAGGEFRNGYQTYDARAVARFLF
jgi:hypothetical protein